MSRRVWFSAATRLAISIGDEGITSQERSVVVFLAKDFDDALLRALDLSRAMESTYLNGDGQEVRWRFIGVETLDQLGQITDGREVWSEPLDSDAETQRLYTQNGRTRPNQCGV